MLLQGHQVDVSATGYFMTFKWGEVNACEISRSLVEVVHLFAGPGLAWPCPTHTSHFFKIWCIPLARLQLINVVRQTNIQSTHNTLYSCQMATCFSSSSGPPSGHTTTWEWKNRILLLYKPNHIRKYKCMYSVCVQSLNVIKNACYM